MDNIKEHESAEDAILYLAEHDGELFPQSDRLTIAGTKICPICESKAYMILPYEAVQAFANGALIQEAFPFMPAQQRERLITGFCPPCWENLFSDPEDDDL